MNFPRDFQGFIGVARKDITPPVGIYARSWGAATHELAEGIHRPLSLTALAISARENDPPLVLVAADLSWWRSLEDEWFVRGAVLDALSLDESRLMICASHTHAGPAVQRGLADRPGGHLIAPYLEHFRDAAIRAARNAIANRKAGELVWRYGKCDLATNRDLKSDDRYVCGFNRDAPADDTLLVGRAITDAGSTLATIVNYACHPTTLAWENHLISPDYVGAMRETIEAHTHAPCLFLQGASGELAPAHQYVGDTKVADRHGRRLGLAALSTLEGIEHLEFAGIVESGTALAIWRAAEPKYSSTLEAKLTRVELPLKPLAGVAELEAQWQKETDPVMKERLSRKRNVRKIVGNSAAASMPMWAWRIGDAYLVGQPNEAYSRMQIELRNRFSPRAVAVMNVVGCGAGYLPPRELYDKDIYQVWQSPFAAGCLERVTDAAAKLLSEFRD